MLKDINEDNREHARHLLHCIAVAIRPLRVSELAELLTFEFDDVEGGIPKYHADWRWKDQEEAVLSTCSSLITVVDDYDWRGEFRVVHFSHFSVKEFLLSDRLASSTMDVSRYHILPRLAHATLTQACLGCLLHLDDGIDWKTASGLPLTHYATENWVAHAQFEDVVSRVKDGMRSLFDPDEPHLVRWLEIHDIDPQSDGLSSDTPNPLYYASLCGFRDLVEHLVINHPGLINDTYGVFGSPLAAALSRKYIQVAEFLLRHGGEVDVWGTNGQTPLHFVAKEFWRVDHNLSGIKLDAISFLLKHGADVDSRDWDHCTPLHLAAFWDSLEVVQILLERGADIESRNDEGQTPLHMMCSFDFGTDVAQLLLERGANVNARDDNLDTPLLAAVRAQNLDAARIFLAHGAEPNVKNKDGKTSLHILPACAWEPIFEPNLLELASFVLQRGADVNAQDKHEKTPLHVAMELGLSKVAQILLEHGAEHNVVNKDGQTPLHLAFEPQFDSKNDAEILIASATRLLLQRGADVNAQDKDHTTPLLLAIQRKMYDITRVLLARGAKPNVKNVDGKAPLHLLLEGNFTDEDDIPGLVRLLLEHGADVNAQDQNHDSWRRNGTWSTSLEFFFSVAQNLT